MMNGLLTMTTYLIGADLGGTGHPDHIEVVRRHGRHTTASMEAAKRDALRRWQHDGCSVALEQLTATVWTNGETI